MYFVFLVFVLVAVFAVIITGLSQSEPAAKGAVIFGGIALIGILFLVITAFASFRNVSAGHEGLVYTFGKITGRRSAGLVVIPPWAHMKIVNIQTQTIRPTTKCSNGQLDCLEAFSKETQDAFVTPAVNLRIDPTQIEALYTSVGPDYINKIVLPKLLQVIKEETTRYSSVDIAPNRQKITTDVQENLKALLAPNGIIVDYVAFEQLDFSPAFKKSIEDKQIATQAALTAQANVAVKEAEARQSVAAAQGAADSRRIAAQAESDSNNLINSSLTGNILQLRLAQTLGDKIQFLPSGSGIFLDPANILKR